jgi:hypothetical protein
MLDVQLRSPVLTRAVRVRLSVCKPESVPGNRKGYTRPPTDNYNLFGIEHSCHNIDNSIAVRLRHMRPPKRIRKAHPESDLSFPPPFQQQAKYLSLADQFLANNNGHGRKIQAIDSSKRFRRAKKKAA